MKSSMKNQQKYLFEMQLTPQTSDCQVAIVTA
jgi:hypothetical protein